MSKVLYEKEKAPTTVHKGSQRVNPSSEVASSNSSITADTENATPNTGSERNSLVINQELTDLNTEYIKTVK